MVEILRSSDGFEPKLPVFGMKAFLSAKSSEHGWFASRDFVLPFIIDQRLCFRRLIFTSETVPLFANTSVEAEKTFLTSVLRLCEERKIRADFLSTAQANAVFRTVPAGCESLPWGSYIVDLEQPENVLFSTFHSKHRNVIRKAESLGVSVTTTSDIRPIYETIRGTMVRQRLLFYPSMFYLQELQHSLKENISFYLATYNQKIQGAAVIVFNHLGGFYYYGGSVPGAVTGSNNLLQFQIMKDLQSKNVPVYDFMGARLSAISDSKIEGIQQFKRRFASGMRKGFCFRHIIRPSMHRLFTLSARGYFSLKGSHYDGDVIDQAKSFSQTTLQHVRTV
jgi:hypothetical protein